MNQTTTSMNSSSFLATFIILYLVFILILLVFAIFSYVCHWKIVSRIGYPGWYVLLMLIPVFGFFWTIYGMYVLAFRPWPSQQNQQPVNPTGLSYQQLPPQSPPSQSQPPVQGYNPQPPVQP